MKTLLTVEADPQTHMAAADLAMRINALFAACPNLCGFVVEDLSALHGDANPYDKEERILISEVSLDALFGSEDCDQIHNLIVSTFSDLIAAQPQVYELLRGRTFARVLH